MTAELVIFDCDGVLVDSEPVAAQVLTDALRDWGLEIDVETVDLKYRGRSLPDIMNELEAEMGRELPRTFRADLDEKTFAAFRNSLQPIDGVRAVLELLASAGTDLCVASSGSLDKIRLSLGLTKLAPFFEDRIFSATQVARGKPAPDLFLHAAAQMGKDIGNCVVIEDSLPGVIGAHASGARVLGYAALSLPDQNRHAEALKEAGAEVFCEMAAASALLGI
jgi:HAD superfamily hydrolase (TIGR01509 family)